MKIKSIPDFTYKIPTSQQMIKLGKTYKKKYGKEAPNNFFDLVNAIIRQKELIVYKKEKKEYALRIKELVEKFNGERKQ